MKRIGEWDCQMTDHVLRGGLSLLGTVAFCIPTYKIWKTGRYSGGAFFGVLDRQHFPAGFWCMSHELRTPLNAILGFSEIMKTELYGPVGHPRYKEYSEDIHQSGSHLLELINDVLDLSKLDAGQMELREATFDIAQAIENCVLMVRGKAQGLTLEICLAEGMPGVIADRRLIKQILLNLLSNALKFTPVSGRVKLSAFVNSEGMTIAVADTGIGMEAHELEVAFSPYGQVDSKVARQHQGTGLGLPISRALAELHGGTLTANSVKGTGTTVTLFLPNMRLCEPVACGDMNSRIPMAAILPSG